MVQYSEHAGEVANWTCTSFAIAILVARLLSNWLRSEISNASTYLVAISLGVLVARVVCNVYILKYNTVYDLEERKIRSSHGLVLTHAQTGSKLTLAARILVTSFYWLQCSILLLLYRRLLNHIPWVRIAIYLCWTTIAATYAAVILTTCLECRPLSLNWKLSPHPSSCVQAYGQLLVQGISNIVIDLALLVIPTPIVRNGAKGFSKRVRLGVLFTLGIFCIAVTCIRCRLTFDNESSQFVRSFWASVQAVVAAFVANASAIYGSFTLMYRRKKSHSSESAIGSVANAQNGYALMDGRKPDQLPSGNVSNPKDSGTVCWQFEDMEDGHQCN